MELSKTQKILLGVLSVWPPVYIFVFIASIFGLVLLSAGKPGDGNELGPFFGGGIVLLMLLHLITIFLTLGLTVFYIVHAVKNTKLDSNMRIIWIICFFFGGMIAEPIYWYLQIWKGKSLSDLLINYPRCLRPVGRIRRRVPMLRPMSHPTGVDYDLCVLCG